MRNGRATGRLASLDEAMLEQQRQVALSENKSTSNLSSRKPFAKKRKLRRVKEILIFWANVLLIILGVDTQIQMMICKAVVLQTMKSMVTLVLTLGHFCYDLEFTLNDLWG